jgi:hypothetical protein
MIVNYFFPGIEKKCPARGRGFWMDFEWLLISGGLFSHGFQIIRFRVAPKIAIPRRDPGKFIPGVKRFDGRDHSNKIIGMIPHSITGGQHRIHADRLPGSQ